MLTLTRTTTQVIPRSLTFGRREIFGLGAIAINNFSIASQ